MRKKIRQTNGYLIVGILFTFILFFIALFGDWIAPYSPEEATPTIADPDSKYGIRSAPFPPSWKHWLGTDDRGFDLFSLLLRGAKYTLLVVVVVGLSRVLLALPFGFLAAWWSRIFKRPLQVINRVWNAIPMFILLVALLRPLVGIQLLEKQEQIFLIWLIMTVAGFPPLVETIRGHVERIRAMEFMEGVKVLGGGPLHTIRKHILPHLLPHLAVVLAMELAQVLWLLGQLGVFHMFVGGTLVVRDEMLGVTNYYSMTGEWSGMLGNSRRYIFTHPWIPLAPGLAFLFGILSFQFLAEGIRRHFNQRMMRYHYE